MNNNHKCFTTDHQLSRRKWFKHLGVVGAAGMVSPAFAEAIKKKDKQVMFIWLDGGISQLESWDPKPGTRFGGPFRSIQTAVPGIRYSELLPKTAGHAAKIAVARNMSTQDNSHSAGVARIQRGEITDACRRVAADVQAGKLSPDDIIALAAYVGSLEP